MRDRERKRDSRVDGDERERREANESFKEREHFLK
jgi:hypothetical protein